MLGGLSFSVPLVLNRREYEERIRLRLNTTRSLGPSTSGRVSQLMTNAALKYKIPIKPTWRLRSSMLDWSMHSALIQKYFQSFASIGPSKVNGSIVGQSAAALSRSAGMMSSIEVDVNTFLFQYCIKSKTKIMDNLLLLPTEYDCVGSCLFGLRMPLRLITVPSIRERDPLRKDFEIIDIVNTQICVYCLVMALKSQQTNGVVDASMAGP